MFAVTLLVFGITSNTVGPAFAMSSSQQNATAYKATPNSTPVLTKAVKSAFQHMTAAKQRIVPDNHIPNTSSNVKYGNYANPAFVKSSNHEITLQKRSGHDQ